MTTTIGERIKMARDAKGLTQTQLGELVNVTQQSVADVESGKTQMPKNILAYAKALDVNPEWLQFNIGEPSISSANSAIILTRIPLISLGETLAWKKQKEGVMGTEAECIEVKENKYNNCYGIKITGDAMICNESNKRKFEEGDILLINPEKPPKNGDFVIAHQAGSSQSMFRQYIVDGDNRYLLPINSNPIYKAIELTQNIKICGVVVRKIKPPEDFE